MDAGIEKISVGYGDNPVTHANIDAHKTARINAPLTFQA
jgi:hypothetical protein